MQTLTLAGEEVGLLAADGLCIDSEQAALDMIGETFGSDVSTILVPRARLAPSFFDLRSGLLGAVAQKFSNYRMRLIVLGDISAEVASSNAFRDHVRETERGGTVCFARDVDEAARLLSRKA